MTIAICSFRTLAAAGMVVAMPALTLSAECPDGFPQKPVEFVVAYGAGGGTDAIGRTLAAVIEEQQGWTVPVSNRPGAGGAVATTVLKSTKPDGYTLLVGATNPIVIDPYASDAVDYDWTDFYYPGSAMEVLFGLVALEDKPYDTLEELADYARENGRATISTSAIHLERLVRDIGDFYGVEFVPIPSDGSADAMQKALGGHVDATIQGSQHIQQIAAGNMVQLATLTDSRVPYAPDVKTLQEYGMDLSASAYTIFVMPKDLPEALQVCFEGVIEEAMASDAYQELMANFDNRAANLGPDGLTALMEKQATRYQKMFAE